MEKKIKVDTYIINFMCEKCKVGSMVSSGIILTSDPPKYEHRCNKCGIKENYDIRYPDIRYERNDID